MPCVYAEFWQNAYFNLMLYLFYKNAYIVYKEVASNVAFKVDGQTCSDTEID